MSLMAPQMNGVGGQGSVCFPIMSFRLFNKKTFLISSPSHLILEEITMDKKQSSNMPTALSIAHQYVK